MLKRKEVGSSSDCSEVRNAAKKFKIDLMSLNTNSGSARNPNLGSCIEFKLFNVTIKATPFYDFIGVEDTLEATSDEKSDEIESDVTVNNDDSDVNNIDLSLNLSLPHYKETSRELVLVEDVVPIEAVPLNVYNPNNVEWRLTKRLSKSDCDNNQYRLLIGRKAIEDHIMPYLSESSRLDIYTPNGLRVNVLDCDSRTQVGLTLKKWPSSVFYTLTDNWKRDFVIRRQLVVGDVVGLCWDVDFHRLLFSVLRRCTD